MAPLSILLSTKSRRDVIPSVREQVKHATAEITSPIRDLPESDVQPEATQATSAGPLLIKKLRADKQLTESGRIRLKFIAKITSVAGNVVPDYILRDASETKKPSRELRKARKKLVSVLWKRYDNLLIDQRYSVNSNSNGNSSSSLFLQHHMRTERIRSRSGRLIRNPGSVGTVVNQDDTSPITTMPWRMAAPSGMKTDPEARKLQRATVGKRGATEQSYPQALIRRKWRRNYDARFGQSVRDLYGDDAFSYESPV